MDTRLFFKVSGSRPVLQDAQPLVVDLHERHDWARLHHVPVRHSEQEGLLQLVVRKSELT